MAGAVIEQGLPSNVRFLKAFDQGNNVRAVEFTRPAHIVFAGGKGCVKFWDINNTSPEYQGWRFNCDNPDAQVSAIKISQDGQTIVVGGKFNFISVWDITADVPTKKGELPLSETSCNALAISSDSKLCFSCDSTGNISVWDLHNKFLIHQLKGHSASATCIDITSDGKTLWTGSMDDVIRSWDIRKLSQNDLLNLRAQIRSLCCSPNGIAVAVGLQSGRIKMVHDDMRIKYLGFKHRMPVWSLKFAHSGKWFISTGDDKRMFGWMALQEEDLFTRKVVAPVTCSDISEDDSTIVTGSGNTVALYEVVF